MPGLTDPQGNHRLRALTPRELEVLELMADGRSNVGISEALDVSPKTVEAHVRSIFVKLGLTPESEQRQHRRVQAVLTYLRDRRDDPPGSQRSLR